MTSSATAKGDALSVITGEPFACYARASVDAGAALQVGELGLPVSRPSALPAAALSSRARALALVVVALPLVALTAATVAACYYALVIHQDLDEGEPLIYGLAQRIIHHQSLYQAIDHQPFVQVHYTPLYYYAVAALRQFAGSGFAAGRALSVVAGFSTAGTLAYMSRGASKNVAAGGFAALMFLGLGMPGGPAPFMALERVDMLGVAFSVASIAVLFSNTSRRHLLVAGALAALAVLTKQSLFAAGLAGLVWLATVSRRKVLIFGATGAVCVLVPTLLLQWSSGGAFWQNIGLANPDPTSLPFGASLVRELLVLQGIPALLALYYVLHERAWRRPSTRLLMMYWLATLLPALGMIKVGANHNYWIEFAAINSVLATLAVWTCLHRQSGTVAVAVSSMLPVLMLAAQLGVLTPARYIPERAPASLNWTLQAPYFQKLLEQRIDFDQLVQDMSGENGIVLAESMDLAVLANQPVQFEPFAFSMLEGQGRWDSKPLIDTICTGQIRLLVLSYPIELDIQPVGLKEFPMWPRSVMTALRDTMQFEQIRDYHWLYRSPASVDPVSIGRCESDARIARSNPV
jgi:hypothetical protein